MDFGFGGQGGGPFDSCRKMLPTAGCFMSVASGDPFQSKIDFRRVARAKKLKYFRVITIYDIYVSFACLLECDDRLHATFGS